MPVQMLKIVESLLENMVMRHIRENFTVLVPDAAEIVHLIMNWVTAVLK